jgi:D-alanyl-D-alanine carboxypeptidase
VTRINFADDRSMGYLQLTRVLTRHSAVRRGAKLLLVTAVLSLGGCNGGGDDSLQAQPQTMPMADPALTRNVEGLRAGLQTQLGKEVSSLSVLIETPRGVYFSSAVASGTSGVTPDTHFRFASNTKNFTAAAIMKMHQDGWLRYTDGVTAPIPGGAAPYLPDTLAWAVPYKSSITIRQLLQHSAGVFDAANDPVSGCEDTYEECVLARDPAHTFTPAELVAQVASRQLSYFVPGTAHHYSDTGYSMLAEVVARVYTQRSGQPRSLEDYVRDHLTGPTTIVPVAVHFPESGNDQVLPEPRVCGRIVLPAGPPVVTCDANVSAKAGEGNGIGTMRELNRWVRSVHAARNVLSPDTVALMHDDLSPGNPEYGLGTIRVENLGFGHNGATLGNLSLMLYDPATDVSVIVLLPLWDLSEGTTSFLKVFNVLECAGWAARQALGYTGKPATASCPAA